MLGHQPGRRGRPDHHGTAGGLAAEVAAGKPRLLLIDMTALTFIDSEGLRCLLALAELAGDLSEDGMYPNARLLRNAGTHRLVHATTGEPTGPTPDTFSTVNMPELQTSTIEALQVSRAAYLYFVDLIDSQFSASEGAAGTCRLPNQQ